MEYSPEYIEVEIPVPKLVDMPIRCRGMIDQYYYPVDVPPAQYNSILKTLNTSVQTNDMNALPFMYSNNTLVELPADQAYRYIELANDIPIIMGRTGGFRNTRSGGMNYHVFPRASMPAYEATPNYSFLTSSSPPLFSPSRIDAQVHSRGASGRKHRKRKH